MTEHGGGAGDFGEQTGMEGELRPEAVTLDPLSLSLMPSSFFPHQRTRDQGSSRGRSRGRSTALSEAACCPVDSSCTWCGCPPYSYGITSSLAVSTLC